MKKVLLFLLPLLFAALVFGGFLFFFSRNVSSKGALQVTSNPKSKVYLNDQLLGETPLCKCEYPNTLATGEYTIKLVPDSGNFDPFEQKITIEKSVLTVVDRTFAGPTLSDGSIISLKPLSDQNATEMFVSSFPDKSSVLLDNSLVGQTPLLLRNVTSSDHELTVERNGYLEKTIHVHTVKGYRLTTVAFLSVDTKAADLGSNASSSALIIPSLSPSVSPSVSPKVSPSAKPSAAPSQSVSATGNSVLILNTPTGYLNVRQNASTASPIVTKVNPGETYPVLDQSNGWYEIKVSDTVTGWVSGQYVKKQ